MIRSLTLGLLVMLGLSFSSLPARADWPPNPFMGGVHLGSMGRAPAVISDGAGGTFIAGFTFGVGARVQHLTAAGVPTWGAGGVLAGTSATNVSTATCALALDGSGGVIVAWPGASNRAFAQRLDANGNLLWTAGGVSVGNTSTSLFRIRMCGDGAGGAYLAWAQTHVTHGVESSPITLIRRVDPTGALPWTAQSVSTASSTQGAPDIVSDGGSGAIVSWSESRGTSTGYDIYAQRYNTAGTALWAANGANVCNITSDQTGQVMTTDGAGGAIIAWTDLREYVAPAYSIDYFVQRINASGTLQWFFGGLPICRAPWQRADLVIASDGAGGALLAWDDVRDMVQFDIYGQQVSSTGYMPWGTNGLAVCTAASEQMAPGVAPDGAGGALFTWQDLRDGTNYDIYARHVSSAGAPQAIPTQGFPVSTEAGDQQMVAVVSDGHGAAIAAWYDQDPDRIGVCAQRLDALGFPGDPAAVITAIRDVPNDQGGRVKVSWRASYLDSIPPYSIGSLYPVFEYDVYRLLPPSTWQLVRTVPSGPLPWYSAVVASGADSTGGAPANATFRVLTRAMVSTDTLAWYSAPDSGHSVDNLAPNPPAGLAATFAGGDTHLVWTPGSEPDLAGYRIHRLASAAEAPSAQNVLAQVSGDAYVDAAGPSCVYAVTAIDRHGNESRAATLAVTTGNPLPGSLALAFAAPQPNPASDRAVLAFTLATPAEVALEVFDAGGRRVRAWTPGVLAAGAHRVDWDLRDRDGRPVRPGVFSVRLSTASGQRVQRLAVVR